VHSARQEQDALPEGFMPLIGDTAAWYMNPRSAAIRFLNWAEEITRRHPLFCWFSFTILYAAGTIGESRAQALTTDEILTLHVSRLPSMSMVWSALAQGADGQPPFFYVLTRASIAIFGESELALRLPSIVAFWFLCLFVYFFVTRRFPSLFGWIAVLVLFSTFAYPFSFDARPYAPVLAFSSLALVCWQRAADGLQRRLTLPGLTVGLAAAAGSHYFGLLVAAPLALGELIRFRITKRADVAMWISFIGVLVPLLFFLPLIRSARTGYPGSLTSISPEQITSEYIDILGQLPLVMIAFLAVYLAEGAFKVKEPLLKTTSGLSSHEAFAVSAFILLPALTHIAAAYTTHVFLERYSVVVVLGLGIGFATFVRSIAHRHAATLSVCLLLLLAIFAVRARHLMADQQGLPSVRLIEHGAENSLIPIAIEQGALFVRLSHYAEPAIATRLRYLASKQENLHYSPATTVEWGMLGLRSPVTALAIEDYESFVHSHPQFYVYSGSAGGGWLMSKLTDEKAQIEIKGKDDASYLYLVTLR
jgi:dolichyl-phosphate-mannose-protein mannosyltransferase